MGLAVNRDIVKDEIRGYNDLIDSKCNFNIEIIILEEGHTISVDNFTIVKESKNIDNVYLFIESDVMERIVAYYPCYSVNIETNRRIAMDNNIVEEYSRILSLIT